MTSSSSSSSNSSNSSSSNNKNNNSSSSFGIPSRYKQKAADVATVTKKPNVMLARAATADHNNTNQNDNGMDATNDTDRSEQSSNVQNTGTSSAATRKSNLSMRLLPRSPSRSRSFLIAQSNDNNNNNNNNNDGTARSRESIPTPGLVSRRQSWLGPSSTSSSLLINNNNNDTSTTKQQADSTASTDLRRSLGSLRRVQQQQQHLTISNNNNTTHAAALANPIINNTNNNNNPPLSPTTQQTASSDDGSVVFVEDPQSPPPASLTSSASSSSSSSSKQRNRNYIASVYNKKDKDANNNASGIFQVAVLEETEANSYFDGLGANNDVDDLISDYDHNERDFDDDLDDDDDDNDSLKEIPINNNKKKKNNNKQNGPIQSVRNDQSILIGNGSNPTDKGMGDKNNSTSSGLTFFEVLDEVAHDEKINENARGRDPQSTNEEEAEDDDENDIDGLSFVDVDGYHGGSPGHSTHDNNDSPSTFGKQSLMSSRERQNHVSGGSNNSKSVATARTIETGSPSPFDPYYDAHLAAAAAAFEILDGNSMPSLTSELSSSSKSLDIMSQGQLSSASSKSKKIKTSSANCEKRKEPTTMTRPTRPQRNKSGVKGNHKQQHSPPFKASSTIPAAAIKKSSKVSSFQAAPHGNETDNSEHDAGEKPEIFIDEDGLPPRTSPQEKRWDDPVKYSKRQYRIQLGLCFCGGCGLILLLGVLSGIGLVRIILYDNNDETTIVVGTGDSPGHGQLNNQDLSTLPLGQVQTTPLDSYSQTTDCPTQDEAAKLYPPMHPIVQCNCWGRIHVIADDTVIVYKRLKEEMADALSGLSLTDQSAAVSSCNAANQALIWLSSGNARANGNLVQRFLMATAFIALDGTNWQSQTGWLSDANECTWYGIACNDESQVTGVTWAGNLVSGTLPSELFLVSSLESVVLSQNRIAGTLPPELFELPDLRTILLDDNELAGTIPSSTFGQANKLTTLELRNNLLSGSIPTQLGSLVSLEVLDVAGNRLRGSLPAHVGLLAKLRRLSMDNNILSGRLPTELGLLSNKLEYLSLSQNSMKTFIPTELGSLVRLKELRLLGTGLGGRIPTELSALTELEVLDLSDNTIRASITSEIGLLTNLQYLGLGGNGFRGSIPSEVGKLSKLQYLNLQNGGDLSGELPTELGFLTQLNEFIVSNNRGIVGQVPGEICRLRELAELDVFVTDCFVPGVVGGVTCVVPRCCSSCVPPP